MKRVAILQSNYIPWKGYFDLLNSVDVFVLYDDVQYTRRDWRNRNKIKTASGVRWLTIPVNTKGNFHQRIKDTTIADPIWASNHFRTIKHEYSRSRTFGLYGDLLQEWYSKASKIEYLSEVNELFIREICKLLGIETIIRQSSEFNLAEEKSERLLSICQDLDADTYVSGPAAKSYLNTEIFESRGIEVEWYQYAPYKEYEQLHPPFEHSVTILDLLLNAGDQSQNYMNSFADQ
ncbi:MAG: WbqC family protein [Cyanobacteriota/Melainabacteria group bacterium]